MLTDKNCIRQIFGALMKKPQLLSEVDKYSLTLLDFNRKFDKYIFSAIVGLYNNGAQKISSFDIENFLDSNTAAKETFKSYNGIEFLQDAEEFCNEENFPFYYNQLKKLNLLRDLKKQGKDISDYYVEDLTSSRAIEVNSQFENLTIKDIVESEKRKLLLLESEYAQTDEVKTETAAIGMQDFISSLGKTIKIGVPIQGHIYNQVISGAYKGTLTIRSGSSGLGKTRQAVADACYLAYPIRYNSNNCRWEHIGSCEKVLFIVTEQSFEEIRSMILAYLTDINESRFKIGKFSEREWKIIHQALELMVEYEDNFILTQIPNPTIELVKTLVRENCLTHQISHVFYDYIFIGPALLGEFRGFNLRNDEVLLMFATALKDLARELQVSIFTSTQVNASADDNKNIRNESSLAGGRSTINKADNGAIMARPTKEEIEILEPLIKVYGEPNMVTDIFKVRGGEYSQLRIWSIVDLGRMKKQDLFITNSRFDVVEGFFERDEYQIQNWDDIQEQKFIERINELNRKE